MGCGSPAHAAALPLAHLLPLRHPTGLATTSPPAGVDPHAAAIGERLRALLTASRAARTRSVGVTPEQRAAFDVLDRRLGGALTVHLRPGVGTPSQIEGSILQRAAGGGAVSDADEATARSFLRDHRALLRIEWPDEELTVERRARDPLGRRHLRFAQHHRGLAVWPAGLIVHLDVAGNVDLVDGAFVPTPRNVPARPALDAPAAIARARDAVPEAARGRASHAELIVYAPGVRAPRLAWKLTLSVSLASRWLAVVDAVSGTLLTAFDEVPDVNVRGSGVDLLGETRALNVWLEDGTYYLADTSKPMFDPSSDPPDWSTARGEILILDAANEPPTDDPEELPDLFFITASAPSGFDPADGVSAAYALSEVYDYYLDRHERNSLDGQGGTMLAIVRLGQGFFNAFWSGSYMAFGDAEPFAGSLDVVGHELTHGVTDYTAGLVYRDQSGAMNEAFSDIFGESIEAWSEGGPDWLAGSHLSEPLRDMANPERFDDPATFSDFVVTDRDNGGVHTNSGIINHAYYLLAEGMGGAIGLRDAEQIFYRALAFHLVSNSQFVDARLACIAAARELFGADSRQARQTAAAFDAVEIFDGRGTPQPQPFPGVSGVDATLFLFWDPVAEAYFLGRREEAFQDGDDGVRLIQGPVAAARPSVSGDGTFAAFVSADNDVCLVYTDGSPVDPELGTPEACVGFPGLVSSVAVAPDGERFGFVFLDEDGEADNTISVIDLGEGGGTTTYELRAPVQDGAAVDTIAYADSMDFTADGRSLVYDALNQLQLADGSRVDAWSVYALDLASGESQTVVPPRPGFDIGYPALSQRSDSFVVFDVFDQETRRSTVTAADLTTGELSAVGTVEGYGAPNYSGDDTAIVYSEASDTPTEFSLVRQPLAGDRLTPQGRATAWLGNADYSVIYRRGSFVGPGQCAGDCNTDGAITIDELVRGVSIALGTQPPSVCPIFDGNGDGQVTVDELVRAVNAALDGCGGS